MLRRARQVDKVGFYATVFVVFITTGKRMKIIIAGGSGLIGRKLISALLIKKHEITLLSRSPEKFKKDFPELHIEFWDAKTNGNLIILMEGCDVVINLIGESIASKRWSRKQKQKIFSSRINSTRAIIEAIRQVNNKPSVLINASAVGFYGNRLEGEVTEEYPKGMGFLADVCAKWEEEALTAIKLAVRVVLLRTGIVLDKNNGALKKLLFPFKLFLGGSIGSGAQWFPWIHLQDEINAILFSIENNQINGPINLTAPQPVRMKEFCKILGNVMQRPSWLNVPSFILKLALGEMAESLLLHGQKVIPKKLIDSGFEFQFPELQDALKNILANAEGF